MLRNVLTGFVGGVVFAAMLAGLVIGCILMANKPIPEVMVTQRFYLGMAVVVLSTGLLGGFFAFVIEKSP